eukprot:m.62773 g.62773  ORF g.62773 m.62773 type:complete len:1178 (+) comp8112_c0_seq1:261-3794(+)
MWLRSIEEMGGAAMGQQSHHDEYTATGKRYGGMSRRQRRIRQPVCVPLVLSLLAFLASVVTHTDAQQSIAGDEDANGNTIIRIGFLSPEHARISDELAGFLTAVRTMTADPIGCNISNMTFVIEPYVLVPPVSVNGDTRVGSKRAMQEMTADASSYHPVNGVYDSSASAKDVDIVILGGGTIFAEAVTPVAEFNGKPIMSYSAQGDSLSDKVLFPYFSRIISPRRFEAYSLLRIAVLVGLSRFGIMYPSNSFGTYSVGLLQTLADTLGVEIPATVAVPTQVDITTDIGQYVVNDVAASMTRSFIPANIKVYLILVEPEDIYTALAAANQSGIIGPGHLILLPGDLLSMTPNPDFMDLHRLLAGSLGVFSTLETESEEANAMWSEWPDSDASWTDLLSDVPDINPADFERPTDMRADVNFFTHYVWDAVHVAAIAIASSWHLCASSEGGLRLNATCVQDQIEDRVPFPYMGQTGLINFNIYGDRQAFFSIYNWIDEGNTKRIGSFVFRSAGSDIEFNTSDIVWSDGVTNRTTLPSWGQQLLSTPSPTPQGAGSASDNEQVYLYVSVALALILIIAVIVAAAEYERRKRNLERPADFRKIISALEKEQASMSSEVYRRKDDSAATSETNVTFGPPVRNYNLPRELKRRDVIMKDEIGEGQFGSVKAGLWVTRVEGVRMHLPVAIKTTTSDGADLDSAKARDAFLTEATVTWQLDHDNVVRMYGVVTSGLPLLLVLELCEKGVLIQFLRENKTASEKLLLNILWDVAKGMEHLASQRIVHRDLAARNILLDSDTRAKVSDFGLGRKRGNSEYYRMSSSMLLPMRWMDPWAVKHLVFFEATDVWSFGVLSIESFTAGARPYGRWSNAIVYEKVVEGYRLRRPRRMPQEVYDRVTARCWESGTLDVPLPLPSLGAGKSHNGDTDTEAGQSASKMTPEMVRESAIRYFEPRADFAELARVLEQLCQVKDWTGGLHAGVPGLEISDSSHTEDVAENSPMYATTPVLDSATTNSATETKTAALYASAPIPNTCASSQPRHDAPVSATGIAAYAVAPVPPYQPKESADAPAGVSSPKEAPSSEAVVPPSRTEGTRSDSHEDSSDSGVAPPGQPLPEDGTKSRSSSTASSSNSRDGTTGNKKAAVMPYTMCTVLPPTSRDETVVVINPVSSVADPTRAGSKGRDSIV